MNNYFVILAAGKSKRFNQNKPKQFFKYKNKEIIDHSVKKSLDSNTLLIAVLMSECLALFIELRFLS